MSEQIATRRFRHGRRIASCEPDALSAEAARLGVTNRVTEKVRHIHRLSAQPGSRNDDLTRLVTHDEGWAGAGVKAGSTG